MTLLLAGCRLPGWEGPVSRSLADCRRLSQQGAVALDRGQQEKAETLLAQAVAACPVDAEARRRYAEALWRRGARKEAIAQLEAAGRVTPDDAALWTRMAEMQLAAGQVELAGQTADRALDLDTKLPGTGRFAAGSAGRPASRKRRWPIISALGYTPNDRAMLREVAELYRQLNQPDRALQTLQSLAETYSPGEEPADCLYLTGLAYVAVGRYDDGVESLSAAVTRGKPTAEMYCQLGQAELLAGHPPRPPAPPGRPSPSTPPTSPAATCSTASSWPSGHRERCGELVADYEHRRGGIAARPSLYWLTEKERLWRNVQVPQKEQIHRPCFAKSRKAISGLSRNCLGRTRKGRLLTKLVETSKRRLPGARRSACIGRGGLDGAGSNSRTDHGHVMKRLEPIRHLQRHGCALLRKGASHSVFVNRALKKVATIPRHREINEFLARKICRELEVPQL